MNEKISKRKMREKRRMTERKYKMKLNSTQMKENKEKKIKDNRE